MPEIQEVTPCKRSASRGFEEMPEIQEETPCKLLQNFELAAATIKENPVTKRYGKPYSVYRFGQKRTSNPPTNNKMNLDELEKMALASLFTFSHTPSNTNMQAENYFTKLFQPQQ